LTLSSADALVSNAGNILIPPIEFPLQDELSQLREQETLENLYFPFMSFTFET
jgi:hypothetical protein